MPVLAPCPGEVVRVQDGAPDGSAVNLDHPTAMAGNFVLIRCAGIDVLIAHLERDSLKVRPGDIVEPGQTIGAVGNSGASDMPHLHIHAQRPARWLRHSQARL